MLKLMVEITSWVIRILGGLVVLIFVVGIGVLLFGGDSTTFSTTVGLGIIASSILLAIILGATAVLFRLSEQVKETNQNLLDIKNVLVLNSEVKSE